MLGLFFYNPNGIFCIFGIQNQKLKNYEKNYASDDFASFFFFIGAKQRL
jgi:hypothetical protein